MSESPEPFDVMGYLEEAPLGWGQTDWWLQNQNAVVRAAGPFIYRTAPSAGEFGLGDLPHTEPSASGGKWVYLALVEDVVLYVGSTKNPQQRMQSHRTTSQWFESMDTLLLLPPDAIAHALGTAYVSGESCETVLVVLCRPIYNEAREARLVYIASLS